MTDGPAQRLRVLAGEFAIEHRPAVMPAEEDLVVVVRAPEGLTVVRRVAAGSDTAGATAAAATATATANDNGEGDGNSALWAAFYSGASAHGMDVPGMVAALVEPLARASVPVFVCSTFHADLLFVPRDLLDAAAAALRAAGHEVEADDSGTETKAADA